MDFTAKEVMEAHQYLYYVALAPIWTDYEYDTFCHRHGLFGGGGSDREDAYTPRIRLLAEAMRANPGAQVPVMQDVDALVSADAPGERPADSAHPTTPKTL